MKTKDHKTHIGIYGRRNCGKSSIINTLADQQIAIVSDIAGTTTDPVKKSFEILDYAPVILIDTAGIDDTGDLGKKRIQKTLHSISTIDLAILVIADNVFGTFEEDLIEKFNYYKTPFFIIHNKADETRIDKALKSKLEKTHKTSVVNFSTVKTDNFDEIIDLIKKTAPESSKVFKTIIGDLIQPNDVVMLICPIDSEAPSGRMILPQVQLIRDVLDNHCVNIVLQEDQVTEFFRTTNVKPKLAITDSQIFDLAGQLVPKDIPLTSFSTVLARQKGDFENYLKGTPKIDDLKSGDRILILESCSHHVSCEDIGRFKLPAWLKKYCNCELDFDVVSGLDAIQRPIHDYAMVIQCGGCMITKKQIHNRLLPAIEAGIPVSNYGLAIAFVQGIYNRAIEPFKM
ncbi:[FeFe] hydrogenase H-cluster maturation GTPase HydF [Ancylomarina sp. 16SWW S1-10-2]|uniref:[FeFe] hydrogenase H-cluster maturation GTPase HydF n=1 Tax=Ancylomarina sp. 16SWW S1-10-2 TaxID=2499681 RepID=UPI0012AE7714|nr:[FeFe] hydrogenase H-cluster maturation GTPase HydF [Ancylomarina sp. 16SWW S1-10-2]MRT91518.1 [FeFe] hydrogenase H-cluster maturation GTPase HydF [Ancylomarina sp. 16SWW S1-10-2]